MTYPLIQAKHFTAGRGNTKPRLIVVHTMETPENAGRAHQVAQWFAGPTAPQASAHYMVDDAEVYQSVLETDTAWAVNDFALNQASVSIEHAGTASQTSQEWKDLYSTHELTNSAKLAAGICQRWGIPAVKLTPADILAGKSGFCGHNDVTSAKHVSGGHTDPGVNYPWVNYLKMVNDILYPVATIVAHP